MVLVTSALLLVGCNSSYISVGGVDTGKGKSSGGKIGPSPASIQIQVNDVQVVDNQLIIKGAHLETATAVRVTGPSGFDETFAISYARCKVN